MKITIQTTDAQGHIEQFELVSDGKHAVQLPAKSYSKLTIQIDGKPVTAAVAQFKQDGKNLLVMLENVAVLELVDFYAQGTPELTGAEWTFVPSDAVLAQSADQGATPAAVADAAPDAGHEVSTATDPQSVTIGPDADDAGGITTGMLAALFGGGAILGGLALGGGSSSGAGAGGGGGGGGGATSYAINIGVVAGPITDKLNIQVTKPNGQVLQYTTDAQGHLVVSITDGYVGALLITALSNNDSTTDFMDEATGAGKTLDSTLRAVVWADGKSDVNISVTPLTELAMRIWLAANPGALPSSLADVTAMNALVGNAFGVDLSIAAVTIIGANGAANALYNEADGISAAENYGRVLAALSGDDKANGGSMNTTLTLLAAAAAKGSANFLSAVSSALAQGDVVFESGSTKDLAALIASTAALAAPTLSNLATAVSNNVAALPVTGLNAAEIAAGVKLTVAVVAGAVAGDVVKVVISNAAGVAESIVYHVLTAAEVAAGVATVTISQAQLSTVTDGTVTIASSIINGAHEIASTSVTVVLDNTPPSVPSVSNVAAAAAAIATVLPNTNLGVTEISHGVTLPVALPANSVIGDTVIVTIPASVNGVAQTISYVVTAADILNGYAAVTVTSAQLAAAGDGTKTITAVVHDVAGNTSLVPIVVTTVTLDVNPPVVGTANFSMPENSTAAVTLSASDFGAVTWSLVAGSADNILFNLSPSGALSLKLAADFETPNSAAASNTYSVTVRATDAAGNFTNHTYTVDITNGNEAPLPVGVLAPVISLANHAFTLAGSVVAAAFHDPDAGTALIYTATGLPAGLSIDSASGAITGSVSAATLAHIVVTASDGSLSGSQSFDFTAIVNTSTNVLSAPSAAASSAADAAIAAGSLAGGVTALEAAAGIVLPVAVASGVAAGDLLLVVLANSSGLPEKNLYYVVTDTDVTAGVISLPISVSDLASLTDGNTSFEATFSNSSNVFVEPAITVLIDQTPPNAPSTAHLAAAALALAAAVPTGLTLGSAEVANGVTLPVALPANSVAGDSFTLTIPASATGSVQSFTHLVTAADVSAGYAGVAVTSAQWSAAGDGNKVITAVFQDAVGNPGLAPFTVVSLLLDTVAPNVTAATLSMPENSIAALTLSATDANPITWSLVAGGADNSLFKLSSSGALSLKVAADFETPNSAALSNTYTVATRATDTAGNVTNQTYTVNVSNVNEAPAPVGALAPAVALVGKPFTLAGSFVAAAFHDPDAGTLLQYSATGLPAGLVIDATTGAISGTVTSATVAQIVVLASDGVLSGSQNLTFTAIANTSTALLSAPSAAHTALANSAFAASAFAAGLSISKAAAGIALPVPVATGAVAGDIVQLTIASSSSGVIEQTVSYLLTSADVTTGVLQFALTAAQLASVSDGVKAIQATFSNSTNQFAEPTLSLLFDLTAPNAPSGVHLTAAAAALALDLPANLTLGLAEVASGVTLPVALPANSVAGDILSVTLAAGTGGVAQTLTYAVTANDVASGVASVLVTRAQLMAVGDGSIVVTAIVHDALGNVSATPIAVVTLLIEDTAPVFGASSFTMPENSTAAILLSSTDSSVVHYSLVAGGADNALFVLSANGALSLKVAADFETPASALLSNAYSVKVRATDAAGNFIDQIVTVNISNVLEAPTTIGTLGAALGVVNQAFTLAGSVIAAVFHPDTGSILTYSASGLPSGLSIDATTGAISGTPTAAGSSTVIVSAAAGALKASQSFTFTTTVNTSTNAMSTASTTNAAAAAADVANSSLAGGVSKSEAAAGIVIPVAVVNGAVAGDVIALTIEASNGTPEKTVYYTLTAADITNGVAQVPVTPSELASLTDGTKLIVATFTNGANTITVPVLTLAIDQTPPNVPSTANHAAAAAALSADLPANLTLGTNEVQHGVVVPVALPANSMPGDTVTVTIPAGVNGTAQTISYVVTAADVSAGFVSIAVTSAQLTNAGDGVKAITAVVQDLAGNLSVTPIAVVTLTVNTSAPVHGTANLTMPENSIAALHLTATDSGAVTWALVAGGADNALFALTPSGALSLKVAANFEMPNSAAASNTYSVTVRATDAAGNASNQTYTVNLSDVNEAPLAVGTIAAAVAIVNKPFSLGLVGAAFHDPDAGALLHYTASGLPAGLVIDANTGVISGTVTSALSAHIVVTASDALLTATQGFDFSAIVNTSTLTLSAPTAANTALANAAIAASTFAAGLSASKAAAGIALPVAVASGAAAGDLLEVTISNSASVIEQTITYILTSADITAGVVAVPMTGAQLSSVTDGTKALQAIFLNSSSQFVDVATALLVDQTAPNAPSGAHLSAAANAVLLGLPASLALGSAEVASGVILPVALPANSVVGDTLTITVPAGATGTAQTITYVANLADVTAGFASVPLTSAQLTAAGDGSKAITAMVHDAIGNVSASPIAVLTLLVDTLPPVILSSSFSIPENSIIPIALSATDANPVHWSLTPGGADNALFVVSSSGALSLKVGADFETPASALLSNAYSVTLRATDAAGNSATHLVTVNVTNVLEAPTAVGSLGTMLAVVNQAFNLDGGVIAAVFHPDSGSTLTYSASGLPADLSIDPSTGAISGTPSAASSGTVIITAAAGTLTASQSFLLTALLNTSTNDLSTASSTNIDAAAADVANSSLAGGLSKSEAAAGILVPVAIVNGAMAGDVITVIIQASNGTPEQTVYYTLTAADITNGVAQVPVTPSELAALTDGSKTIVATFTNGVTSITVPVLTMVIDQTPPNVPSTANNTAAALAMSTDLPANLTLGTTEVQHGVVLPVALPANSTPGDTVTVTIPAGVNGTAQTISHVVTAADVSAGFVSIAVTSAQLTNAGDGVKAITAVVQDVAGNLSVTPIAVVTLTLDTTAPVVGTANLSMSENSVSAQHLTATDSSAVSWALLPGGADNALFVLSASGALSLKVPADFETPNSAAGSNSYSVTVRATDAAGNFTDHTYTVNLSNVNEAPAPVGLLSSAVAMVNHSFSLLGSVVAGAFHDLDAGDSLTYSASGMPSGLTINASTGAISGTVTAATNAHILVTATDSGGLTGIQGFNFSAVLNTSSAALSAPTGANTTAAGALLLAGSLAGGVNAAEAALGIVIPVAVASGAAAGDLVQVTIANGASVVEQAMSQVLTAADITAGVVQVPATAAQLAALSDGSKTLQATFLNSSSQFAEAVFALAFDQTPPNAPSGAHLAAAQTALAQDLPASLVLGTSQVASGVTLPVALPANSVAGDVITLTIPAGAGGSVQSLTYTVLAADVTAGFAAVAVSSAQLHGAGDGLKAITALVHDAIGNVSALPIAVVSLSINTVAPIFTGNSFTMLENSVTPVTLTATDLTAISWTLSGTANDNNLFTLGSGGALSLKAPANFEALGSALHTNAYSVLVRATDVAGNYNEQTVTVNLLNVNEAPVAVGTLANVSVNVNQAFTLAASTVANAFADPDIGTVLSYSISGQPPGFSINASTGAVTGTATALASTPFHVVITASDGSLTATQSFDLSTISVPTISQIAHPASIEKGGNSISFTVTMSEAVNISGLPTLSMKMNGQVVTAQYSSGSGSSSLIFTTTVPNSGDGSLIVVDSLNLPGGASITGVASGLAVSSNVSGLGLSNVVIDNTSPVVTTTNLSLPENSVTALSLLATDVSAVTWALVSGPGVDNGLFNLSSSGALSLKAAANFEQTGSATGTNAYTVSVSATDAVGHITNQLVTVNITNVNETPVASGALANVSTGVNQPFTVAANVVAAAFTDPDAGTVWHYSISGQPAGVSINVNTGAVTGLLSAATATPYHLIVTATDGTLSATQNFDLSAHPVPTILGISHSAEIDAGGAFVSFTVNLNEAVTVAATNQFPTLMLNMNGVLVSALYQSGTGSAVLTFQAQLPNTGDGSSIFISAINVPSDASVIGNTTGLPLATNIIGQSMTAITIDNTAPVFGNAVFALAENSVAALNLTATDLTALHWALAPAGNSNDNALFALSGTGALTLLQAADFETPDSFSGTNAYSVLVDVTDAVNHVTERMVTVNVTNVNEAPTLQGSLANVTTSLNVPYDLAAAVVAGAFVDPDTPTTWSYSATGLPHGLSINSSTGEISGTPDVGTTSAVHVVVTASDGQLTAQQPFDMSVIAPMHLSSALNGVSNLDVQSTLVLSSTDTVASAVAGKFIHLIEDGGAGNDIPVGETAPYHNQDMSVTDTSLVTIVNGHIVINPTFDLDFAGNYHIEVDAGAFLGAGGEPSAAISDPLALHFSSVTPGSSNGTASIANAVASQIMANDGSLSASYSWLSLAGMGSLVSPLTTSINMGTSKIAFVFRDDAIALGNDGSAADNNGTPDDSKITDGIGVGDKPFDILLNHFNANDLVYVDDQRNPTDGVDKLYVDVFQYDLQAPGFYSWDAGETGLHSQGHINIASYVTSTGQLISTSDPAQFDGPFVFTNPDDLTKLLKGSSYVGPANILVG